jgi:hypothetical protein
MSLAGCQQQQQQQQQQRRQQRQQDRVLSAPAQQRLQS